MDKPNQKTNNLLDGLEFLKENGIDLDVFLFIGLWITDGEIYLRGKSKDIEPLLDKFTKIGFEAYDKSRIRLFTSSGTIKIVWD